MLRSRSNVSCRVSNILIAADFSCKVSPVLAHQCSSIEREYGRNAIVHPLRAFKPPEWQAMPKAKWVEWLKPEFTASKYNKGALNHRGFYRVSPHLEDVVWEHKTAVSPILGLVSYVYPLTLQEGYWVMMTKC